MDGVNREFQHTLVKRPRRNRRLRNGLSFFLVGLVGALFAFFYWRDMNPQVEIPSPVMPSPNAYDDFTRAAGLLRDIGGVGDAESSRPQKNYSVSQKAALVQENAPALQALRVGLTHPYLQPPARSFSARMANFTGYRGMARLLVLESWVRGSQGDWIGAASSDLDCIQFGVAVPHGGSVIALLVGEAIEAIGQSHLWLDVPHMNSGQTSTVNARLQQIMLNRGTCAETFENEKFGTEASLLESMQKSNWRWTITEGLAASSDDNPAPEQIQRILFWLRLAPYSKQQIVNNYASYMDGLIANARAGYGAHHPEPPLPNDPINQILAPVFSGTIFRQAKDEAATALLVTSLALHAYKLDHRQSPHDLSQLIPGYLKSIPTDPFAGNQPLHYLHTDEQDVVYSVGPDSKDDHGTPCATKNGRHTVDAESRGDMVAGMR